MTKAKLLMRIQRNAKNIRFSDFISIVHAFGFAMERTSGSHHIFARVGIPEMVNIQNKKGEAKPYQIKQFLALVEKYNLTMEGEQ